MKADKEKTSQRQTYFSCLRYSNIFNVCYYFYFVLQMTNVKWRIIQKICITEMFKCIS